MPQNHPAATEPKALPEVGVEVVLSNDVDRFPHCIVKQGETGTVAYANDDMIGVKLHAAYPDLQEWDNCVEWYAGNDDRSTQEMIEAFYQDVAEVVPSPAPGPR